jgi:uncharacterized protein YcnI
MNRITYAAAALAALLAAPSAIAHVTLDGGDASAGSFYKATFNVPHGCSGSPTTRLRIRIPAGVTNVKPQPKPGWELATVKEKLDKPIPAEHGAITETVREVIWSGGRLSDDNLDEFKMLVRLPATPGATLYFPVVQECEQGVTRWIEIPEPGKTSRDYKEPAPALRRSRPKELSPRRSRCIAYRLKAWATPSAPLRWRQPRMACRSRRA